MRVLSCEFQIIEVGKEKTMLMNTRNLRYAYYCAVLDKGVHSFQLSTELPLLRLCLDLDVALVIGISFCKPIYWYMWIHFS